MGGYIVINSTARSAKALGGVSGVESCKRESCHSTSKVGGHAYLHVHIPKEEGNEHQY